MAPLATRPLPASGERWSKRRIAISKQRAICDSPAACGERSDSERSEGIRVRGRSREPEPVDKPPHPICLASPGLRPDTDLPPPGGGGGRGERWSKWRALPTSSSEPYAIALPSLGRGISVLLAGVRH